MTSRAVYLARLEMVTTRLGSAVWSATAAPLIRWLRGVLRSVLPMLGLSQPTETDVARLAQMISSVNAGNGLPPNLPRAMQGLAAEVILGAGFLPRDPRAVQLAQEIRRYIANDAGAYWRTLTDANALASKIASAREAGQTGAQIQKSLVKDYRANVWAAERLVRTTYTAGANLAQYQALRAQGYTQLQWLTARDGRVRRGGGRQRFDHVRMEGVTVPIDVPFTTPGGSRMRFPGDRSLGALIGDLANCRCNVIGVRSK